MRRVRTSSASVMGRQVLHQLCEALRASRQRFQDVVLRLVLRSWAHAVLLPRRRGAGGAVATR